MPKLPIMQLDSWQFSKRDVLASLKPPVSMIWGVRYRGVISSLFSNSIPLIFKLVVFRPRDIVWGNYQTLRNSFWSHMQYIYVVVHPKTCKQFPFVTMALCSTFCPYCCSYIKWVLLLLLYLSKTLCALFVPFLSCCLLILLVFTLHYVLHVRIKHQQPHSNQHFWIWKNLILI